MCTFVSKLDPELSGLQEGIKTARQQADKPVEADKLSCQLRQTSAQLRQTSSQFVYLLYLPLQKYKY
jgi:hypothetical protein